MDAQKTILRPFLWVFTCKIRLRGGLIFNGNTDLAGLVF